MATTTKDVAFTEAKTRSDELTQSAANALAPTLTQFAQLQQARTDQLAAALDRLKSSLGEDHPRVQALGQTLAAANLIGKSLKAEATRAARRPSVSPNEYLVHGRVLDEQGRPVPGLRVRVFDRDRKYDDLLGDTTTDEHGDFAAKYHERDFAEMGEAQPELYVMIEDAAGTLLYSTRDQVRFQAGRVEYFEIVLGEKPAPPVAVKKRARTAK
jgi:Transthyretin-like family